MKARMPQIRTKEPAGELSCCERNRAGELALS